MSSPDRSPDTWATAIPLPAHAEAPALARQFVETHARGLPAPLIADALIIVSELVTNAVLHGQPEIQLRFRNTPPGIGLAVQDGGADVPKPSSADPDATRPNGRGLRIVDALSSSWGVTSTPPGKIAWFELHEHP